MATKLERERQAQAALDARLKAMEESLARILQILETKKKKK